MKDRHPKDMTRMSFGLLRFVQRGKEDEMLTPKTHFEQVPLEVVKKIVAEQIKKEELAERTPGRKSSATTTTEDETN
jgi:hypothetical protein